MADLINGFPFDSADFSDDAAVPLVRIRDVLGDMFETFVPSEVVPESVMVRDGDVVIGMDGDFNVAYWSRGPAALNQRLCLLRGNGTADTRFLAYALPAHLQVINDLTYATTVKHLSSGQVRGIRVNAPDLAQQRAIADYLDRETARIDRLTEEQQRLIEMLRERRESVITRAVTQGLKPAASTMDTGVPTLDRVPSHWTIVRVKNVGRALIGLTYAPENIVDEDGGGTLVLRAGNIRHGQLALDDNVYVNSQIPPDLRLQIGDIVICARNGSPKLIGKNAVATEAVVGQTWGAFMVVIRSEQNDYLRWVLNSQIFKSQAGLFSTATINQLTSQTLHNLRFALPPLDEQRRIAAYLEEQTAKIDTLIAETERFIELSRERRSAVIAAAVTGQIDVRRAA